MKAKQITLFHLYYFIINVNCEELLNVKVFYESMCPDVMNFFKSQITPNYPYMKKYVKFQFYPYGKATTYTTSTGPKFNCHHGELECLGNKVHSCAKRILTDMDNFVIFARCFMISYSNYEYGAMCAKQAGGDWTAISNCAKSVEGANFLKKDGKTQAREVPDFDFVPWITINGKRSKLAETNLKAAVCQATNNGIPYLC